MNEIKKEINTPLESKKGFESIRPTEAPSVDPYQFISDEINKYSMEKLTEEIFFTYDEGNLKIEFVPSEKTVELLALFKEEAWFSLDKQEQTKTINELAESIAKDLGIKNIPAVLVKELSKEECGSFSVVDNQITLNSDLFNNPTELVNTIAHETRHAYQWMRADLSENHTDQLFKMSHLLYITPEEDWYGYYNQYVEVDARVFANIITEALK